MNRTILRMEIAVNIRQDEGSYWADVPSLPGCFASGHDLDELVESLCEGIELYLSDGQPEPPEGTLKLTRATLSDTAG